MISGRSAGRTLFMCATLLVADAAAQAQDVSTIRFGRQTAAEDNLWLMIAKPELARNYGKAYKVEWAQLRASDIAFKASEANQVDMISTNANASIVAASNGVDMKIIASLSREFANGAHTYWLGKVDGGPDLFKDLKGKTIGILGYRTGIELWARAR